MMNFDTVVRYFFIDLMIFMACWIGPMLIQWYRVATAHIDNPLKTYQINSNNIKTAYFEMDGGSRYRSVQLKITDEHGFNYKLNLYKIRKLNLVGHYFSDFDRHNEIVYVTGQDYFFNSNVSYESSLKILSVEAIFQSRAPLTEVKKKLKNPNIYFNHITKKPTKEVIEIDVKYIKFIRDEVVYEFRQPEKYCDYCYLNEIQLLN